MPARRARELRAAMTAEEVILWSGLKRLRALGFQFRRQAPFRTYYLDFVCFQRRLVVEADGSHHRGDDRQAEHDMVRDAVLRRQGFEVMRFANGRIRRELGEVVGEVLEALRARPAAWGSEMSLEGASPSEGGALHVTAPP